MASEFPASLLGRLSFLLGKLYFGALEHENRELEALGTDVKQQAVLSLLTEEGSMTQQQLGQRLGIDRTTIVNVVDGLEESGFVERRRSPEDRRAYLLTLTSPGKSAQRRGQRLVDKAERQLLGALTDAERQTLTRLLVRALDDC
jgi:DNA-binding MarR family transcriptional regulator